MMVSISAFIVLLMCLLFIRSTIIRTYDCGRVYKTPARVNALSSIIWAILTFVPYANWVILIGAPIMTFAWFCSDGFNDRRTTLVEINEESIIGKILLFKI